jgi:hypothetical protein
MIFFNYLSQKVSCKTVSIIRCASFCCISFSSSNKLTFANSLAVFSKMVFPLESGEVQSKLLEVDLGVS